MKRLVMSVYDKGVQLYAQPFFCNHVREAMRGLQGMLEDKSSSVAKWPNDYTLMSLGTFDDEAGVFEQEATGPVRIIEVGMMVEPEITQASLDRETAQRRM